MTQIYYSLVKLLRELAVMGALLVVAYLGIQQANAYLGQRTLDSLNITTVSYQSAMNADKPVILNFSALWCSGCRKFNARVLQDQEVADKIAQEYSFVHLDYDNHEDKIIFEDYRIQGFPVVLMLDSEKRNIRSLKTQVSAEDFLAQL